MQHLFAQVRVAVSRISGFFCGLKHKGDEYLNLKGQIEFAYLYRVADWTGRNAVEGRKSNRIGEVGEPSQAIRKPT